MRLVLYFIGCALPTRVRYLLYKIAFGWSIHHEAKISRLAMIGADSVIVGRGGKIGAFTVIKKLRIVSLGEFASIGRLNWITGYPVNGGRSFLQVTSRDPSLFVGDHAAVTNRHLIDCTDSVHIGRYATFAGFRSQILTHSIDLKSSMQACKPISIGEYAFIGTGVILLGGSEIPPFSVVGAGSVVVSSFSEPRFLYAGNPAKAIKTLGDLKYFERPIGAVS